MNPDEQISYAKSQYKKFIKDVTEGTLERKDLIDAYKLNITALKKKIEDNKLMRENL